MNKYTVRAHRLPKRFQIATTYHLPVVGYVLRKDDSGVVIRIFNNRIELRRNDRVRILRAPRSRKSAAC